MRKKIYHACNFRVKLLSNLDLECVKSLVSKDRLESLLNLNILLYKCVKEFIKKLTKYLLNLNINFKVGKLGENGKNKKDAGFKINNKKGLLSI